MCTKMKVAQYTKDGKLVKIHNTQTEASKSVNGYQPNINRCIWGYIKSAYGYIWKEVKENETEI